MKKIILIIAFFTSSLFVFSETIVCPHCGQSFTYNKTISEEEKDGYKIVNLDTYSVFYKDNKERVGSKLCIKNLFISSFADGNRILFRDENYSAIVVHCKDDNMIMELMELMELKNKYFNIYGITTTFVNSAYFELNSFEVVK